MQISQRELKLNGIKAKMSPLKLFKRNKKIKKLGRQEPQKKKNNN